MRHNHSNDWGNLYLNRAARTTWQNVSRYSASIFEDDICGCSCVFSSIAGIERACSTTNKNTSSAWRPRLREKATPCLMEILSRTGTGHKPRVTHTELTRPVPGWLTYRFKRCWSRVRNLNGQRSECQSHKWQSTGQGADLTAYQF